MLKEITELLQAKRKANIRPVSVSELELIQTFGNCMENVRELVKSG